MFLMLLCPLAIYLGVIIAPAVSDTREKAEQIVDYVNEPAEEPSAVQVEESEVVKTEEEFDLDSQFAEFLGKRGSEMAKMVDTGDAPVVYGATAQRDQAGFAVFGATESVDPSVVLQAQGADDYGNFFENTVGLGSQMMIAEPGTILMGPDFQDVDMINNSPHMDWISPITQMLL